MATRPYTFLIELMICGYHEYGLILNNPIVGEELVCEELVCERELGNNHDPYAVAVIFQNTGTTTGSHFKITCNIYYTTFSKVQNFGG